MFDLYTGSSIPSLASAGVKVGDGRGGHIYLVATAGVTYVIRLDDQFNPADWVLNWSDGQSPGGADTTPPDDPTLSSTNSLDWSNDNTVDVQWSGASDEGSGVDGFSYEWSQAAGTVPDTVKEAEETATGATSPPLADGQWWFHLRTGDNTGNWSSPVHLGPFKIDTTAPVNPALSSTHTSDWSSDTTVPVDWSGATDAGSGVDGYSIAWSQQASTEPDAVKDTSALSATSPPLGDGQWWFHLRADDKAGNWSAPVHLGPFRIDATAPSNPTVSSPSHTAGEWSNDPTVDVAWSDASDGASGVDGYSIAWSQDASTAPDAVKGTTGSAITSQTLPDGDWWFHLRTRDNAGNWSSAVHLGPFRIDTVAPTNPTLSSPSHTVGEPSQDSTVEVEWASLLEADGYSYEWSQEPQTQPDELPDADGTTTSATSEPLDDGSWWFHLRARAGGNWSHESHMGPFVIDTTTPVTTITSGPSGTTTSTEAAFEFFGSEPASYECALDGGPSGSCASPVRYAALAAGTHVFRVRARDRAGNIEATPAERAWTIALPPQPPVPPPPPVLPPLAPPPSPPRSGRVTRCVVPRLTGRTLKRSRTLIARAGCRLGRVRSAYSLRARKARVFAQAPKAGRRLPRGTRVSVWISLGPRPQRR